jgi:phosphohistidine phosphatase SixA
MIVFALRHADRMPDGSDNLSPAGVKRAELLARMLGDSGASAAFHSDARRTALTLQPLKRKLGAGLTLHQVPADDIAAHVAATVAALRALPSAAVAVVAGHSNTVPDIIAGLGGGRVAPIGETEFDKLFVVCLGPAGQASAVQMRYGAD